MLDRYLNLEVKVFIVDSIYMVSPKLVPSISFKILSISSSGVLVKILLIASPI